MDPHENYGGINRQKNPYFFLTGKHPQIKIHTEIARLCDLIDTSRYFIFVAEYQNLSSIKRRSLG